MNALQPREQFLELPHGELVLFRGLEAASRPIENLTILGTC